MVRKVNKGLSLVEVIIALAIFMLMMVPIVSSLISSMKTTGTAKELQSRNEYAQNLIETMKEVPIDALKNSKTSYFEKMGSEDVSISYESKKYPNDTDPNAYPYDRYVIHGKTYLGVEHTQYAYTIEMSSRAYAVAEGLGKVNPNNVTSGVVQDLDKDKVALISATISNYDNSAYTTLLKKKLSEMKNKQEAAGNTYDATAAANLFKDDTGNRMIKIEISKDVSGEYDVKCTLYYSDNSSEMALSGKTIGQEVGSVDYLVYEEHFKKLPDIYLMYNLCVYNEQYANEYITYDVSGLDATDKVNVFVVQTASNYSEDVKTANGANNWLKGGSDGLYRKAGGVERDSVKINMALISGATGGKLQVYHNMYRTSESSEKWEKHKKNETVQYDDDTIITAVQKLFGGSGYVKLEKEQIHNMDQAQKGNRGLYEVKVWMQEGSSVDTSKNPMLQGTRGGGEID